MNYHVLLIKNITSGEIKAISNPTITNTAIN
ncbi:uncharacterized protein METZ01_LOCUS226545 [marine metagenome]|uniref:Uncharacterized protein n=1 Tax=marine metagenome TaxID=408172 RepID=A0A382GHM9_9ZZZZ